jgi:SH3-like domain-containing protein
MRLTAHRRDREVSRSVAILAFGLALAPAAAGADDGSTVPRFASIRAGEANLRTGPGVRYPIEWVFVHPDLPVEIVAEYQVWRKVRDFEGAEGWMHQSMLSKRRSVIVTGSGSAQPMRRDPVPEAPLVAEVEPRVVGRLLACADAWCRVEIADRKGWMLRSALWGVRPNETMK